MPYLSRPTQWAGNPGPASADQNTQAPGWTAQDYSSPVDLGRIQETERDPGVEMSYDPNQPARAPQNLVRSLVPTKIQPVKPEDVEGEEGTRWPFHQKPRKEGPKPKPMHYTTYPGGYVQDIEDHPDMRDPNRIQTPAGLSGRSALHAWVDDPRRPEAAISETAEEFMRGYIRGWTVGAQGIDRKTLTYSGLRDRISPDWLEGELAGYKDGQTGNDELFDLYTEKLQSLGYLVAPKYAKLSIREAMKKVCVSLEYMREYVQGWKMGEQFADPPDLSQAPPELATAWMEGYEDGRTGANPETFDL